MRHKVLMWVAVVVVGYLVVTQPSNAADFASQAVDLFQGAVEGISTFMGDLS